MSFKRENRYLVVKKTDFKIALSASEQRTLQSLLARIANSRKDRGKPVFSCVVVESDWPEYEPTWNALKSRMEINNHEKPQLTVSDSTVR